MVLARLLLTLVASFACFGTMEGLDIKSLKNKPRSIIEMTSDPAYIAMLAHEAKREDMANNVDGKLARLAQPYNSTMEALGHRREQVVTFFVVALFVAAVAVVEGFYVAKVLDVRSHETVLKLGELNVVSLRGDTEIAFQLENQYNVGVDAREYLTIVLENASNPNSVDADGVFRVDVRPREGIPKVKVYATRDMFGHRLLATSIWGTYTNMVLSQTNATHIVKTFVGGLGSAHYVDGFKLSEMKGRWMWKAGDLITEFELEKSGVSDAIDRASELDIIAMIDKSANLKDRFDRMDDKSNRRLAGVERLFTVRLYVANPGNGVLYVHIYSYGDDFHPSVCRVEGASSWGFVRNDYMQITLYTGTSTAREAYVELMSLNPTLYRVVVSTNGYGNGVGAVVTASVNDGNDIFTLTDLTISEGIVGFKTDANDIESMYVAAY